MLTVFKKSRIKIVAAIMSVLMCLFAGTLAIIFISSYYEVLANNYAMLERHTQMYLPFEDTDIGGHDNRLPDMFEPLLNNPQGAPGGKPFEDSHAFQLSTFYAVALANDGSVLSVDAAGGDLYDKETLTQYAADILEGKRERGTKEDLVFLVARKSGYTLVAFMDNTIMQESMSTLFRYTLVFGTVALICLFFLAVYLAGRIVKPLEESYQKQKQFISDAGHELKTPVSVVSANAELLSREIGDNQWLMNIQYENERMGELVCQLLELARTESVTVQKERLDFGRLAAGGVLPFESVAFEKGLVIHTKIAENIWVNGNSSQLSQLVSILVDNAIRHGQAGKEVTVCVTENRSSAVILVANDGDPIPPNKMEQLFERFYRTDEARSGEDKHYGLGLAIAKAIVTAHHGKIEAFCRDGKVCFSVQLPKG